MVTLGSTKTWEGLKYPLQPKFYGHTSIRRQVEVKDGDDSDEDARKDDVQHIVKGLPLDDQVEDHPLVFIVQHDFPARPVFDVPLAALWCDIQNLRRDDKLT